MRCAAKCAAIVIHPKGIEHDQTGGSLGVVLERVPSCTGYPSELAVLVVADQGHRTVFELHLCNEHFLSCSMRLNE